MEIVSKPDMRSVSVCVFVSLFFFASGGFFLGSAVSLASPNVWNVDQHFMKLTANSRA
jgi:hypothetical protein